MSVCITSVSFWKRELLPLQKYPVTLKSVMGVNCKVLVTAHSSSNVWISVRLLLACSIVTPFWTRNHITSGIGTELAVQVRVTEDDEGEKDTSSCLVENTTEAV